LSPTDAFTDSAKPVSPSDCHKAQVLLFLRQLMTTAIYDDVLQVVASGRELGESM
jgi:hypothetical protein